MKKKPSRRVLSLVIAVCMIAALLPASALAANESTAAETTDSGLTVEYFTSTLYNWDEDEANKATAAADVSTGYTSTTVAYSTVASSNNTSYTSTSYYYEVDGTYYPVYYTRSQSGGGLSRTTTYTLYYLNGSTYTQIGSTTNGNDTVTLYTSGGYEGKGFYFTNGGNKQSTPVFSQWLDNAQNYMIYSGLAASKLSESSNAPFNDETVNAANLFASTSNDYTDVYTNVQVPFVYDEETGYYTLDSDSNAVYFANGTGDSNTTMEISTLPAAHSYGDYYATGFLPFNSVSSTTTDYAAVSGSTSSYTTAYTVTTKTSSTGTTTTDEGIDWGFGMVTSVDFQMTDDGKDEDGNVINFKFSGDDDVWVYIDGYLVLDIGGTHDAITGTIDFSTGAVELTAGSYGQIGDLNGKTSTSAVTTSATLSQDNIYDVLGTTLTGFASSGNHTLTIYYMERGRGRSNCLIKFNLPQKDSVSVTKEISDTYTGSDDAISDTLMTTLNNIDFTFTLYKDGAVVPNKSYSLYDSGGNLIGTGSTDSAGTFTIKNGQTATFKNISLDDKTSYYVVETSPGDRWTASWTESSNVSTASITDAGGGLTSGTVTVTGSSTTTDTISFVCTNSYAPSQSDPDIDLNNDTIVLDYGLPVEVNVLANDLITVDGEDYKSDESVTLSLTKADEDGTVTGTYGTAEVKTDDDGNQTIVYTMTSQLCGIETISYTVSATHAGKNNSETATLTIIPATLMYYEESFGSTTTTTTDDDGNETTTTSTMVSYSNGNVEWKPTGTSATGYQETGFVGTTTDSTYGADAVYLNELGDSYGTSMYANVGKTATGTRTNDDGEEEEYEYVVAGAAFEYDFTGTGTAILSRISTNSAYIQVKITNTETNEVVDTQYIDTRVVKNVSDNTVLYNIPVYNNDDLNYGTYHVYVYVYKAGTTVFATYDTDSTTELAGTSSGGDFYLDGIRVYQPMGTDNDDVEGYSTAASAYATDGESNVSIINIRAKIAADNEEEWSGDEFGTLTDTDGNIINVDTYTAIGPNEELYLTENQTVSFYLVNWDSQSYKIYLGLKAPGGETAATVSIGGTELTISNSTVCYYDISSYVTVDTYDLDEDGTDETYVGTLTITGTSGLSALTNLKVTGIDTFELGYPEDIDTVSLASLDADTLYLLPTTISLTADDGTDEDEAVVFTPESIKMVCNYSSKTKKATITVSTSTDVARVTINGEDVTSKKVSNQLNWSKSYTKVTKGTEYEIVVYDADGNASETYTVTAE